MTVKLSKLSAIIEEDKTERKPKNLRRVKTIVNINKKAQSTDQAYCLIKE